MPWLEDLVTVFSSGAGLSSGIGTYGTDLFTSTRAVPPQLVGSATIQIIETGGGPPSDTQNFSSIRPAYLHPGAQIICRADDYATARAKAHDAWMICYRVQNMMVNSGWYRKIKPMQEPFDLTVDNRGQAQVMFNVLADYNRRD